MTHSYIDRPRPSILDEAIMRTRFADTNKKRIVEEPISTRFLAKSYAGISGKENRRQNLDVYSDMNARGWLKVSSPVQSDEEKSSPRLNRELSVRGQLLDKVNRMVQSGLRKIDTSNLSKTVQQMLNDLKGFVEDNQTRSSKVLKRIGSVVGDLFKETSRSKQRGHRNEATLQLNQLMNDVLGTLYSPEQRELLLQETAGSTRSRRGSGRDRRSYTSSFIEHQVKKLDIASNNIMGAVGYFTGDTVRAVSKVLDSFRLYLMVFLYT